jgi:hypothetical protein
MTQNVRHVLDEFDRLTRDERQEAALEILRRTLHDEQPPLGDDDLTRHADHLFVDLDAREAADECS